MHTAEVPAMLQCGLNQQTGHKHLGLYDPEAKSQKNLTSPASLLHPPLPCKPSHHHQSHSQPNLRVKGKAYIKGNAERH